MRYVLGFRSPELYTVNQETFSTDSETHVFILCDFEDLLKTLELSLIPVIKKGDFVAFYDMFPSYNYQLKNDIAIMQEQGATVKSFSDWINVQRSSDIHSMHGALNEMIETLEEHGMDAQVTYSLTKNIEELRHSNTKQEMATYYGYSLPVIKSSDEYSAAEKFFSYVYASNAVLNKRLFEQLPKYHTTFGNVILNKNGKQFLGIEKLARENIFTSISIFLAGNSLGVSIVSPNESVNFDISQKFFDDISYFHKNNKSLAFIQTSLPALVKSIETLLESEIIPDAKQEDFR